MSSQISSLLPAWLFLIFLLHFSQQNCWFLCSVLQEHLRKASAGEYTLGGPVVPDYAPGIRFRIQVRVYHETNPLQVRRMYPAMRQRSPY